jgi:hypothetical protein
MRQVVVVCFLVGAVCALLTPACDRPNRDRPASPVPVEAGGADSAFGGTLHSAPSATASGRERPIEFEPPEVILDGSEYGRLYPAFADIDGDGKIDMLVGNWLGRLLVFRNKGTNARPVYARPTWLDETLPSANIAGVQG